MSSRKSQSVTTRLVGGAAGLTACFVLSGCQQEDPVQVHAYQSVDECLNANVYDDGFCRVSWQETLSAHAELAPRYEDVADCEVDFGEGQCGPLEQEVGGAQYAGHDGGSFIVPFIAGYLVGNNNAGVYRTPVYSTSSSGYRSLSGQTVAASAFSNAGQSLRPSSLRHPQSAATMSRVTTVMSRGGFGATGRGLTVGS